MADVPARADALWRAITFLSVAQLHLQASPLVSGSLDVASVKRRPSGHWGTVPGSAWALAHVAIAVGRRQDSEIIPLLGAGHAGVVQRALAWLTGDLGKVSSQFPRDAAGLAALVSSFPDCAGLGSEVHPSLPAGAYVGGWLGGALAFAQGMALEAPARVVVPILGDGECETPATAASWLAQRELAAASVLPVIHLNGHRMGGPSLLGTLRDEQVSEYFRGLGWVPVIMHVRTGSPAEHSAFHEALVASLDAARGGERTVLVLRCVKGWSGPVGEHKTPLTDPAGDPAQRAALWRWLSSYRAQDLLDRDGQPVGALAAALDGIWLPHPFPAAPVSPPAASPGGRGFSAEVSAVLRAHAQAGSFKIFSPDELRSNRLGDLASEPWAHELLAEEVLLGWLAGWTATGRRGLLVSYEAFAPLLLTGLIGHLKQRRLAPPAIPSLNLLLTSYGWHNVYTHGDPSLSTALLGSGDPAVHVFTPADANRAALALDDALRSNGQVNVIIAGKHASATYPRGTIDAERRDGLAIWIHLSDPGEPDLTLVCAGDLAAAAVSESVAPIRERHQCRVRVVNVHDLTALASAGVDPSLGRRAAVVVATLGHPAAIWGLLAGRARRRVEVLGWREPPYPMTQKELAAHCGLDVAGVTAAAAAVLGGRER